VQEATDTSAQQKFRENFVDILVAQGSNLNFSAVSNGNSKSGIHPLPENLVSHICKTSFIHKHYPWKGFFQAILNSRQCFVSSYLLGFGTFLSMPFLLSQIRSLSHLFFYIIFDSILSRNISH
jgi:hypothetical protein